MYDTFQLQAYPSPEMFVGGGSGAPPGTEARITEASENRLTEDGELRITE